MKCRQHRWTNTFFLTVFTLFVVVVNDLVSFQVRSGGPAVMSCGVCLKALHYRPTVNPSNKEVPFYFILPGILQYILWKLFILWLMTLHSGPLEKFLFTASHSLHFWITMTRSFTSLICYLSDIVQKMKIIKVTVHFQR